MIKRYRIVAGDFGGEDYYDKESPDGPYVEYDDHVATITCYAEVIKETLAWFEHKIESCECYDYNSATGCECRCRGIVENLRDALAKLVTL